MINLNTPSDVLLNELIQDYDKAEYWLLKKLGGEKKTEELRKKLERECFIKNKDFATGDVVEYISPKGNRWLMYFCTQRYGKYYHTTPRGFCYYETFGSIGAFMPSSFNESTDTNGCVIFTSHFFLRFCERMDIKYRSREMVKTFIDYVNGMIISYKGAGKHGLHEADISLPGSIGRGRFRKDCMSILEVNTFLKNTELSSKQQKETAYLQEVASKVNIQPAAVRLDRIARGDDSAYQELWDNFSTMGYNSELIDYMISIPIMAQQIIEWYNKRYKSNLTCDFGRLKYIIDADTKSEQIFLRTLQILIDVSADKDKQRESFWSTVHWLILQLNGNKSTISDWNTFVNEANLFMNEWMPASEKQ